MRLGTTGHPLPAFTRNEVIRDSSPRVRFEALNDQASIIQVAAELAGAEVFD